MTAQLRSKYEPYREKTGFFAYAKTKTQISFAAAAKQISAFVFATRIVQSLFFLNPKFQASSHLVWLYSPVCVGPGRKPRRSVFSQRGSYSRQNDNSLEMKIYHHPNYKCMRIITQTRPCNKQQYFTAVKMLIFR